MFDAGTAVTPPQIKIQEEKRLGLPPGGVAVTEIGLSPGREHDGAVLVTALGEGERKGGGAAHNLVHVVPGQ